LLTIAPESGHLSAIDQSKRRDMATIHTLTKPGTLRAAAVICAVDFEPRRIWVASRASWTLKGPPAFARGRASARRLGHEGLFGKHVGRVLWSLPRTCEQGANQTDRGAQIPLPREVRPCG